MPSVSLLMAGEMKLLIDTNIIIGLEDAGEVKERFADLVPKCGEHDVVVFVHEMSNSPLTKLGLPDSVWRLKIRNGWQRWR